MEKNDGKGDLNVPGVSQTMASPEIISEQVRLAGTGGPLGAYVSRPAGQGPYPAVLVIHDNRANSDYIKDVTKDLARQGYVGLSVSLISRSLGPDYPGGSDEVVSVLGKLSDADCMADLGAGIDYLKKQPVVFTNSIGCLGFCMGGRYSLLLAAQRPEIKAAVVFYGRIFNKSTDLQPQQPFDLLPRITAPLLGNYGTADKLIPVEDVRKLDEALTAAGKVHDIKFYPEAQHAFHRKDGPTYRAEAALDAWARAIRWFDKYLKA